MDEWDMNPLWVKFYRQGSLNELDEHDPMFLGEEIQAYLERDGLDYHTPSWQSEVMVWVKRNGYGDEAVRDNWAGPYMRAIEVVRVDVWDLKYHYIETRYRGGTRLADNLTEIEGFVLLNAIVGAPTREEAYQVCHDFIDLNCQMCGTMKWEIMR